MYTHIFSESGKYYLYNAESNFFSEISYALAKSLEDNILDKLPTSVIEELKEKKILILGKDKYQYFYTQLLRNNVKNFNPQTMTLIMVPTTACNFACPYCFEESKPKDFMDDTVIEKLWQFIKDNKTLKTINITWYGGEPTLALSQIQKILDTIFSEKDAPSLNYHNIITNGYLFDQKAIDLFKRYPLHQIQITLDGLREAHNLTRPLKNSSEGTFDRIIENIKKISEQLPDTNICIRVNINKSTYHNFLDLYDYFKPIREKHPNISLYPGFIREETEDGLSLCDSSYTTLEFNDLYEKLIEHGVDTSTFPKKTGKGCMVHDFHAYIIGPRGEIYKCWNDIGNMSKIIGNITDDSLHGSDVMFRYMFDTLPFNSECKECSVFPLCDGGCSYHRFRNLFNNAHFSLCSPYRDQKRLKKALMQRAIKHSKDSGQ